MTQLTKSVLIQARNLIDEKGLSHGQYERDDGSFCTYGAIIRSTYPKRTKDNMLFISTMYAIGEQVAAVFGAYNSVEVFNWNDRSTKEEVIAKFDKVIASMPDEEQPA